MDWIRKKAFLVTIASLVGLECVSVFLNRLPFAMGFTPLGWTAMVRFADILVFLVLFSAFSVPVSTAGMKKFIRGSVSGLAVSIVLGLGFFLVLHLTRTLWGVDLRAFVNPGFHVHKPLSLAVLCLLGPFTEEIFFRGLCYTLIRAHTGIWGAVALSSLLFGVSHLLTAGALGVVIAPLVGGIVFALLYEYTGSLFAPFTLHAVGNFILFSGII